MSSWSRLQPLKLRGDLCFADVALHRFDFLILNIYVVAAKHDLIVPIVFVEKSLLVVNRA